MLGFYSYGTLWYKYLWLMMLRWSSNANKKRFHQCDFQRFSWIIPLEPMPFRFVLLRSMARVLRHQLLFALRVTRRDYLDDSSWYRTTFKNTFTSHDIIIVHIGGQWIGVHACSALTPWSLVKYTFARMCARITLSIMLQPAATLCYVVVWTW